jgi:threonylcarbamoyladenosine tRNA methylthiotransferase MtaB
MPTFRIITLGCKVNQTESDAAAGLLAGSDWRPAIPSEDADLCLINTCAVTQKAAMQSRQAVRQTIRANPRAFVAVTGCYAYTDPQALLKIKGLDCIIDQAGKARLPEILHTCGAAKCDRPILWNGPGDSSRPIPTVFSEPIAGRTRPFIKIQDGCDAFCTYCIVPYARGPSRSSALQDVIAAIEHLSAQGAKEVVLTGVHIGLYGRDLHPVSSLGELLECVDRLKTSLRVRLSSIEPLELTDQIIALVAGSDRFCRHFHIPLQSGDRDILKRMGRPYRPETFSAVVSKIHAGLPDAAIGADVLVGFPGETEAAFENTLQLIEALPVTYLHVFPFSARPGTPAQGFSAKVHPNLIRRRCARLRELGNRKRIEFHRRFIGKRVQVLLESRRDRTGFLKGVTSNYLPVLVEGDDTQMNQIVDVVITTADNFRLVGLSR